MNIIDYNILLEQEKDYFKSKCHQDFKGIQIDFIKEENNQDYICLVYQIIDNDDLNLSS